jgi:hypothetical protein
MSYAVTVFAPASLRTGNVSACLSTVACAFSTESTLIVMSAAPSSPKLA